MTTRATRLAMRRLSTSCLNTATGKVQEAKLRARQPNYFGQTVE